MCKPWTFGVRCNRWKCWLNRLAIVLGVQVQTSSEIVTNFSQHHSRNWPIFSTWQPIMASMRGDWTFKLDETETSSSVILCPHMGCVGKYAAVRMVSWLWTGSFCNTMLLMVVLKWGLLWRDDWSINWFALHTGGDQWYGLPAVLRMFIGYLF